MRKSILWILAASMALFVSCYDDSELSRRVTDVETTVSKLSDDMKGITGDITAIRKIVDALEKNVYVSKVEAYSAEGRTGQTVYFTDGTSVVIYNGKDGENGSSGSDGHSPVVGVKLVDGVYYWTVDNQLLKDAEGKNVPVTGKDGTNGTNGTNGKDGKTPQFRINGDRWEYSFDGEKWIDAGRAVTEVEAATGIFKSVEDGEDAVTFVLSSGTEIVIPKVAKEAEFKLVFETTDIVLKSDGETKIPYTIEGAGEDATTVEAVAQGLWQAEIEAEGNDAGNVVVTPPAGAKEGKVVVFAANGKGKADMKALKFAGRTLEAVISATEVPAAGGELTLTVACNVDYTIGNPVDWISVIETRAVRTDIVTLAVAANEGAQRSATIEVLDPDGVAVQSFEIVQLAGAAPAGKLTLVPVWSMFSTATNPWYEAIQADGAALNAEGQARSVAMDDEYIYLPKSSAYAAVFAVSIADKSVKRLPVAMAGQTFQTCFARMIKNTDPAVNGGKDVLLVSNLSAGDATKPFTVYAYSNGIDQKPVSLAAFIWDSANNTNDWRRYGDRFFVTGSYQEGTLVCPSFNASKSVILSVANGARTAVKQIFTAGKTDGIIDATVYPGGSSILFSNASVGLFASADGNKSNGWDTYPKVADVDAAKGSFGYGFFEFSGKKYIARTLLESEKKARLQIFEDPAGTEAGFPAAIAAEPVLEAPLQSESDFSAEAPASSTLVDCSVRTINGEVFIAALLQNGALRLFKLAAE